MSADHPDENEQHPDNEGFRAFVLLLLIFVRQAACEVSPPEPTAQYYNEKSTAPINLTLQTSFWSLWIRRHRSLK